MTRWRASGRFWISVALLTAVVATVVAGVMNIDYRWRWRRAFRYVIREEDGQWVAGDLLHGLLTTLQISGWAAVIAFAIGVFGVFAALARYASLRALVGGYVNLMRCTPLLVQLYLLYFMFGNLLGLDRLFAGVLALALFEGAFVVEILRTGVIAVPQAQVEAARALGLRPRVYWRRVILPQALPLMLPPMANLFVSLIKHSSIVTIIAIADLTDTARNLVFSTFLTFEIWMLAGGLYVMVCLPLALMINRWERALRRAPIG